MNRKHLSLAVEVLFASLMMAGCGSIATPASSSTTIPMATLPTADSVQETEAAIQVAFVTNGDIYLWDSESRQSSPIVRAGDATTVKISDDGQVIAFVRRVLVEQPELMEFVALWAVDRGGKNPRELISADLLRQHLQPETADSGGFAQIEWIPGTHRLVYSGLKFYAAGQGSTNSKDIYVVDADGGSETVLAPDVMPDTPFINAWSFVISPDGQQIALISATELSFINIDGSNWRRAVLTYPAVGMGDAVLLPRGIWTEDSNAFVFTGPMESDSPFVLNYTIWRVPAEGSPAQSLATITDSHSSSVTFSPDGQQMAFRQDLYAGRDSQAEDYRIMPLAGGAGPLAVPFSHELFYTNVHWSPAGEAFAIRDKNLLQLCPDVAEADAVCGSPIHLGNNTIINSIHWIDGERFLFTGLEPSTLSMGSLNGTILPIVTWTVHDVLAGWSYYTP